MSFFLAQGEDARREAEKKNVERNFIRLKDGESVRGFLLSKHFPCYYQHGDYERKIHGHTCADPSGKHCLSCQHGIKKAKKWAVPIFNVDSKRVEVFEASSKSVKAFYSYLDEYEDDALNTPISLKRSGNDQTTTYTVMPVRVKKDEQELFKRPDFEVGQDFYEAVLAPPDEEYLRKLLGLDGEDEEIQPIEDVPGDERLF